MRAIIAAVISAALLTPAPAHAADLLPTRFSEFTLTPSTVDVDHDTVTYTGRLVSTGTDGVDKAVPNIDVCAGFDGGCVRHTTTDADGRFTTDITLTTTGQNPTMVEEEGTVTFRGAAGYHWVRSNRVPLHVQSAPTRISLSVYPTPHLVGDKIDVSGRLERQTADGGWTGAPGQPVTIYIHDPRSGADFPEVGKLTAADGSFAFQTFAARSGQWIATTPETFRRADGVQGHGAYQAARAETDFLTVKDATQIVGFNATPNPVGKGSTVTGRGQLTRTVPVGANVPVIDGYADLQFSTDGKSWKTIARGATDRSGHFTVPATATADGYWRAVAEPVADYLTSTSSSAYVDVRYRTAISGFNAAPESVRKGGKLTVGGTLKRDTTAWKAFSGQSVKIYFAADGATSWTYEGTAKTTSTGHFSHAFTAAKDGTWRATYAGGTAYLAVTGSGDHVDVR